jgi:hypothetical protein
MAKALAEPGLVELADNLDAGHRLQSVLENLGAGDAGRSALMSAADLLTDLSSQLAGLERKTVSALAAETLTKRGYTVHYERGDLADGIEAWSGDEIMLLAVTDGGTVISDQAGAGGACAQRQADFEAGMASRGATLCRVGMDAHGSSVGPLIAAAAATGEDTLARGVARHGVAGTVAVPAPGQHPTKGRLGSKHRGQVQIVSPGGANQ